MHFEGGMYCTCIHMTTHFTSHLCPLTLTPTQGQRRSTFQRGRLFGQHVLDQHAMRTGKLHDPES